MIGSIWQRLSRFLERPRRRLLELGVLAAADGLAEATVLVLVVRVALAIAGGARSPNLRVPLIHFEPSLVTALWVAMALNVVSTLLHVGIALLSARMSSDVLSEVRTRAVHAFLDAEWSRQAVDKEGALQETVSTLANQSSQVALTFSVGCAAALNLVMLVAVAAAVDPVAMLVVVLCGALLFLAVRPVALATRRRARRFVDANARFSEDVGRMTSLAMDLRVFGVEDRAADDLARLNTSAAQLQFRARFLSRFGSSLYRDVAVLFLVVALAALHAGGGTAVAGVGTVVILIVRSISSAQGVQSAIQTLSEQGPSLELLEARIASLSESAAHFGRQPLNELGDIDIDDVSYHYGPNAPGISHVSVQISQGEVVGIVGPSGAGKSTLAQVLLRLRLPDQGSVSVSGIPFHEIRLRDWSRLVALVSQEPRLMEATIAENIAFFREHITLAEVEAAADRAHIGDEIRALDLGFDTPLGPRGGGLSGGQKQRVAIARALVGSPQLLVLDEPTSALDVHSEALLQRTIAELKGAITILIVAHRPTTLATCDRLLVLRDGHLETVGTPEELLRETGFFRSMSADWAAGGGRASVTRTAT